MATPYSTVQQARDAGATGTDAEITTALTTARDRIDRYTGDRFAPTPLTIVATVRNDGTALLPFIVRSVDSVTPVGSSQPLAAGAWQSLSSLTYGQIDAVVIGTANGRGDPLIAGAEPWNGGWANLLSRLTTGQIQIAGTFGWDAPPPEVISASAELAAAITTGNAVSGSTGPDTDDEGNVVRVTVAAAAAAVGVTTGSQPIDARLAHLRRDRIHLSY